MTTRRGPAVSVVFAVLLVVLLAAPAAVEASAPLRDAPIGRYEGSWVRSSVDQLPAWLCVERAALCAALRAAQAAATTRPLLNNDTTTATTPATKRGVFPSSGGTLRVHSVANVTGGTVSVALSLVQGRYVAPGTDRDIVLVGRSSTCGARRSSAEATATAPAPRRCTGVVASGRGFRHFWDREPEGAGPLVSPQSSHHHGDGAAATSSHEREFLATVRDTRNAAEGRVASAALSARHALGRDGSHAGGGAAATAATTTAATAASATARPRQRRDGDGRSFRHLLNPTLWTADEEQTYATCAWMAVLRQAPPAGGGADADADADALAGRVEANDGYSAAAAATISACPPTIISALSSRVRAAAAALWSRVASAADVIDLAREFQMSSYHAVADYRHDAPPGSGLSALTAIDGVLIGVCNRTLPQIVGGHAPFALVVARLHASRRAFDERVLMSHAFAGLLALSAFFEAFAVFALDTVARRTPQAQLGLSFAALLWIVSWDIMMLGVQQVLVTVAPWSCRLVYLGMAVRVLSLHLCGVPLIARVRRMQLAVADRRRWLVADFSVWRYFGIVLVFILVLFLLADRMLSWPVMFFVSLVFLPQIVQNLADDEATQPLPRFVWAMAASMCIPVCYVTAVARNVFDIEPQPASAAVFVASLAAQALALHAQVLYGARSVVPGFLLPRKFPYRVAVELARAGASASSPSPSPSQPPPPAANSSGVVLLDRTTTCAVCQGLLAEDPTDLSSLIAEDDAALALDRACGPGGGDDDDVLGDAARHRGGDAATLAAAPVVQPQSLPAIWRTPCKHLFHAACLRPWLEVRLMCPVCRQQVPKP